MLSYPKLERPQARRFGLQMYFHIPRVENYLWYSSLYQILFFFSYHLQIGIRLHLYATWYEAQHCPWHLIKAQDTLSGRSNLRADRTMGIVVGWVPTPQRCPRPNPQNLWLSHLKWQNLSGKRHFAGVIKLRPLTWEDGPGLARWAQCEPNVKTGRNWKKLVLLAWRIEESSQEVKECRHL